MEMQFAFDEDEVARLSPPTVDTCDALGRDAIFKRPLDDDCSRSSSGEDNSRSVALGDGSASGWPTAHDFADLTFKDVPDCDEPSLSDALLAGSGVQQSAAICIPQNGTSSVQSSSAAQAGRRKKRRPLELGRPRRFDELYEPTGEQLGAGAYGTVATYRDRRTQREYAVKRIEKRSYSIRARVFKEIEIFNACAGHPNVVQLTEFYETDR